MAGRWLLAKCLATKNFESLKGWPAVRLQFTTTSVIVDEQSLYCTRGTNILGIESLLDPKDFYPFLKTHFRYLEEAATDVLFSKIILH